ncbi:MAG: UvrB/UvrC motif-containing protein [Bacillota bacterium]|nr:UvrB/UvrC motif-containing protein [Bacillota bacterium]
MYCEECGERPATVHLTKIQNNKKTELHLCEECARHNHEFPFNLEPNFSIHKFLAGLLDGAPLGVTPVASPQCPKCKLTYGQFSQVGRFGCSDCYQTFSKWLGPLFRRVQGNSRHGGKLPRRTGGKLKFKQEIERLREELQNAIRAEAYERAAQLRDRIRTLEQKIEQGGGKE